MNFHDKRVHPAFLLLTSFLILISYRIISNIIAQNAETGRIGQGQGPWQPHPRFEYG